MPRRGCGWLCDSLASWYGRGALGCNRMATKRKTAGGNLVAQVGAHPNVFQTSTFVFATLHDLRGSELWQACGSRTWYDILMGSALGTSTSCAAAAAQRTAQRRLSLQPTGNATTAYHAKDAHAKPASALSWLLRVAILSLICVMAFSIRLFAVVRWESVRVALLLSMSRLG